MSNFQKKFELKPNTGSLFKNNYKQEDKHPDYKGEVFIEGIGLKEISAWIRPMRDGKGKWMSLTISEPWKKENKFANKPRQEQAPAADFDDDELPPF